MTKNDDVFERKVIYTGKPFIKAGEEHARAYIIQKGLIRSYILEDDEKIEVSQYGPGRIIGEVCLMSDEPMDLNYEAVEESTVITMTRADFQKRISKMDSNVSTILEHVMTKLNMQYAEDIDKAKSRTEIDDDTYKHMDALLAKIPPEQRHKYEKAILPHVNALVRTMKVLKGEESS
ncbi:MAG: cyclic nucleotide-binding domain-containing protein [Alphaproteobacteria bacterium]|nr:cyclic nucleotide-binding domain-containing protein [Alphaproteobacteria bacterium]